MSSLKANQTLANNDTLPVYRSVARKWLLRYWLLLTIILIIILGLIVYWPILEFTFFWEDPYDVGQVEEHSYIDLFLVSTNGLYYRPLHLALVKLLKLGLSQFIPYPFFIFNLIARIVGSLLLFGFARRLTNSVLAAFGAALIFLFTPIPFDSTAKAMSAHQALLLPYITALWLYLEGRLKERPLLLGLSIAMVIISLLVHESAILLPLIILSLELYLYRQRYVTRFARVSLIYLVPVGFFVIVWFAIPKNQSLLAFDHGLEKALYLSQSLSFPFAWLISRIGGLGLEPWGQATIAIALTLALIVTMYRRKHWPKMLLWIFWWLITSSLLWLTLSFDYLQTGSRLLYLPSLMAALIWGGILLNGKSLRSHLSKLLVLLILLQSLVAVSSLNSLYGNGSTLMKAVLDAGKKHKKILFINLPDRFEYRQPLYPLGFWGMMLAPVSQQLADFVWLNTSNETQTLSLSNFPLADSMFMVSPYQVHTRGSDSYGSKLLYDSLIWADESYWVSYKSNGEIMMEPI